MNASQILAVIPGRIKDTNLDAQSPWGNLESFGARFQFGALRARNGHQALSGENPVAAGLQPDDFAGLQLAVAGSIDLDNLAAA